MEGITPRTAILEFAAAHASTLKTPAAYFPKSLSDVTLGTAAAVAVHKENNKTEESKAQEMDGELTQAGSN